MSATQRSELDEGLARLLGASSDGIARSAVATLRRFGDEGVRAVTRRVRQLSLAGQRAAIELAEYVKGRAGLVLLEQLLQLGDETIENQAIYAIGNISEPDGVRILLGWLGGAAADGQLDAILLSLAAITTSCDAASWKTAIAPVDDQVLQTAGDTLDGPAEERGWGTELVPLRQAISNEIERRRLRSFGTLLDPDADSLGRSYHRRHLRQAIEERLSGKGNRSLILVGPAGAGKTSLVHELCHRLGPDGPADIMLQTSTGLLLVGTRFLGEWQTRVRELLDVVSNNPRLLVYVTDINNLLGAGTTAKSEENIADFLAPHVQQGTLTLIGECTGEELRRGIEQRPAFRRLFQVVHVEGALITEARDITIEVGQQVARQTLGWLGRRVEYSETFFPRLMEIADQFRSSAARPGRSIDLLRATVKRVTREAAQQGARSDPLLLEPHHIVETLARESGVPRTLLDDREHLDLNDVRTFLAERVIGQEDAVDAVVDLVTLIKAGLTDPSKPTGVLFFVGPTGVGKTELAKALAEYLFGSADRMIRLDMSEFTELSSVERLIGSPMAPEWSPLRQGLLTGKIRQQPMSVVLLDEFEKAHRAVFDLMLQVMDDGRLTDVAGRVAHFTQAIIIMTSNIGGSELFTRGIGFREADSRGGDDHVLRRELERVFRPEFINRLDRLVPFRPLSEDAMEKITRKEIAKVLMRSGLVRRDIAVDVGPSAIDLLLDKGFDPRYGARPLKREVERRLLLPLARAVVDMGPAAEHALLRLVARDDDVFVDAVEGAPVVVEAQPEDELPPDTAVESLRGSVERVRQRARELETRALDTGLAERKTRLVEASGHPAFWDNAELARRTLSEIHWLERLLSGVERVRKRADDLNALVVGHGPRQDERLARAQTRLVETEGQAVLLGLALTCRSETDRQDAFVRVEVLGESEWDEPDAVETILRMYLNWGRRHRYQVDVVDEHVVDGTLVAGTLRVEGLCPYGILRHEHGVHRLVRWSAARDAGQKLEHVRRCVAVIVLPVVESAEPRLGRSEVVIQANEASGKGVLVPRYRTRLSMRHVPSGRMLQSTSDKSQEEAEDVVSELMRSFLVTGQSLGAQSGLSPSTLPVRSYAFGARTGVRDDSTRTREDRTDTVLNGALETFLEARLEEQPEIISGAN